ncbi:MAG: cob(I)yrinic acid a,c-diamide adenosyltransferase [Ardenticatenaceae bacterium]|nr:cob(I)yrinic acid a,c-diamide adenosyltransferase [Anaerolineales bacterium]MCB8917955.1 cob(I)yrinic acid a,c-diamide adenosyltransferase [Ardenticatenaceae bacterium]
MPKLTKIYTRKGDDGTTSLGGGQRVPKDSLRVQAYGTVDELNAAIGIALAHGLCPPLAKPLVEIQNELFHVGSDLCFIEEDKVKFQLPQVQERHVARLEALIDELNDTVGPLQNFILPGGSVGAANLHLARTICRRAEREVMMLARAEAVGELVLPYLNRLSDALFVMARYENHARGVAEPLWDSHA